MKPFIETFTGKTFSPLDPVFADIAIEDIAHHLSNQCRFSGAVRFFYSVAEHSVRVSNLLDDFENPIPLWGLLHDASEAYLVDLPRPLKDDEAIGNPYREAEAAVMRAVCQRFALPEKQPEAVTHADEVMLATEVRDLLHGDRSYWKKLRAKPNRTEISPWSPAVAEYEFLKRFRYLGGAE